MRGKFPRRSTALSVAALACLLTGCPLLPMPPEAVLEGEWFASLAAGGDAIVTFDERGVVTRIRAAEAQGRELAAEVSNATTVLDGDALTITIPLGARGTAMFNGVLAADRNAMTGTLTRQVDIGDGSPITIPSGDLTLARTTDCNGNELYDHREIAAGAADDCDGNGTPDACDIAADPTRDQNGNGIPDSCEQDDG